MAHVAAWVQTFPRFLFFFFLFFFFWSHKISILRLFEDVLNWGLSPWSLKHDIMGHFTISSNLKSTEEEKNIVGWGRSETKINRGERWGGGEVEFFLTFNEPRCGYICLQWKFRASTKGSLQSWLQELCIIWDLISSRSHKEIRD